jgi:hypothetical protein
MRINQFKDLYYLINKMLKSIYGFLFKKTSDVPNIKNEPEAKQVPEVEPKITDSEKFKKSVENYIEEQKIVKNVEPNPEEETSFGKWIPDDDLYVAYMKASSCVGQVPNLQKKIKFHEDKIATRYAEVNKIMSKEDLNPFDRMEMLEYKLDISSEESKIASINLQLNDALKYDDDPIFERYVKYVNEAEEFIQENDLSGIMSMNDILSSELIYFKLKEIMDSLKFSGHNKQNKYNSQNAVKIMKRFNLQEVHDKSRGNNLRDFVNFFTIKDEMLNIFDEMDTKILSDLDSEKMRDFQIKDQTGDPDIKESNFFIRDSNLI